MNSRLVTLFLLFFSCLSYAQANLFDKTPRSQFVSVDQAFAFDFSQNNRQLTLSWKVKPGYYLYRQQIRFNAQQATLDTFSLPPGQPHEDEFYGKTQIFSENLTLPLTLKTVGPNATFTVTYQGCAVAGFCYPPETRNVPLAALTDSAPSTKQQIAGDNVPPELIKTDSVPFSPLWALLIGIGVAFTPCVLPMYPLISGIILGGRRQLSWQRLFSLAFVYVQGMAMTYTILGIIVASAGLRFQAALQQPAVLITLSGLFILLALSMFGLFTLQLPAGLQTRLALWSNRQQGGSLPGVFMMGSLAGLICSPCTTAPLSAILLYITQSGNVLTGAGTLYLYALGMGLPLILVTLFGNRFLPKSGPWMQTVKEGFGFIILALPVFLLSRIIGDIAELRLWSTLIIAFSLWGFCLALKSSRPWARMLQIALLAVALIAARPLQEWVFGSPAPSSVGQSLAFQRVSDVKGLNSALKESQGRITMLDLYADWCVACKEFEKYTFRAASVQNQLSQLQLLQANVTANNARDNTLLQHLQVLGLPTILFFDKEGREIPDTRITGFMNASEFHAHLQKLLQ